MFKRGCIDIKSETSIVFQLVSPFLISTKLPSYNLNKNKA